MKLCEINRTSVVSWSQCTSSTNLIACGSIAGSLEADFSSKAKLDLFSISLDSTSGDLLGTVETNERFNKLSWSKQIGNNLPYGLVAGAMTDDDPLLSTIKEHKSSIKGLGFNRKDGNIFASGSDTSEVYHWDLRKPSAPVGTMFENNHAEGHKLISDLKWNPCHSNILCTTSRNGSCVVWSVEKQNPMIMFENTQKKKRYSSLSWNPEVMTQLAVGCEDDNSPCIELWELKTAYEPLRVLKGHTKGILSLSWCPFDSNLLLSSGKDGRTIIWNPNTGEMLGEIPSSKSWMFDVQWSFRPSIFSTACFDSKVAVYSLQDSSINSVEDKDPFVVNGKKTKFKTAPKWIQRLVGVSFGFGAKLVSIDNKNNKIRLFNVHLNKQHVERAQEFSQVVKEKKFESYCLQKSENQSNKNENDWKVLSMFCSSNKREKLLNFLGYDQKEIEKLLENKLPSLESPKSCEVNFDEAEIDLLIQKALVIKNIPKAVEICLKVGRFADALIMSEYGGEDLVKKTKLEYFKTIERQNMKVNLAIMRNDLELLIKECDIKDWKNFLAVIMNFSENEKELQKCMIKLGERLENEKEIFNSLICNIFAGNFEKVVDSWLKELVEKNDKDSLFDLIEKVVVFKSNIKGECKFSKDLEKKIEEFSVLLSNFGLLKMSMDYFKLIPSSENSILRNRVMNALSIPPKKEIKRVKKKRVVQKKKKRVKKKSKSETRKISTFDPFEQSSEVGPPPQFKGSNFQPFEQPKKQVKRKRRTPRDGKSTPPVKENYTFNSIPKKDEQQFKPFQPPPLQNVPLYNDKQKKAEFRAPPTSFQPPPIPPVDNQKSEFPQQTTFQPPPTNFQQKPRKFPPQQQTGFKPPPTTGFQPPPQDQGNFFPTNQQSTVKPPMFKPKVFEQRKEIPIQPEIPTKGIDSEQETTETSQLKEIVFKELSYNTEGMDERAKSVVTIVKNIYDEVFCSGKCKVKKSEEARIRKGILVFFYALKKGGVEEKLLTKFESLFTFSINKNKVETNKITREISKNYFNKTRKYFKSLKFLLLKYLK